MSNGRVLENILISSAPKAMEMGSDQVLDGGLNDRHGTQAGDELNVGNIAIQMELLKEYQNVSLNGGMQADVSYVGRDPSGIVTSGVPNSTSSIPGTGSVEVLDVRQKKGSWKMRARERGQKEVGSFDVLRLEKREVGAVANMGPDIEMKENIVGKKRELAALGDKGQVDWGLR
ncbi:hypothetical protein QYF36_026192 [Acer negundo]|nr:hypothetical protein QYF36_026192 [Acer negundo]